MKRPENRLELLLKGRCFPPVTIVEAAVQLPLTDDEREAVRQMMDTPGWHLLIQRIWPYAEYSLLMECTDPSDHTPYSQGKYEGFKLHEELARRASQPRPKPEPRPRQRKTYELRQNASSSGSV